MTTLLATGNTIVRSRNAAALIYLALIVGVGLTILSNLTDIWEQYRARNASLEMLSKLESKQLHATSTRPPGSPLLKGQTATAASAALLQRLTAIITNAGGTLVSTEMLQQETRSKKGHLIAIANCELPSDALQKVLYDIEANVPFLFIEQLIVQAPSGSTETGQLRVTLGVAAQWAGAE